MLYQWVVFLTLWTAQVELVPAYVSEGDQVERQFRAYRNDLDQFYEALRDLVDERAPGLFPDARDRRPPAPVVYGYRLLPPFEISVRDAAGGKPLSVRTYSWPIAGKYVADEREKLRRAVVALSAITNAGSAEGLGKLVDDYEALVDNQETVDQHIQYNRFWQRSVAERF